MCNIRMYNKVEVEVEVEVGLAADLYEGKKGLFGQSGKDTTCLSVEPCNILSFQQV